MAEIRTVTPDFAVAPQLSPADMIEAARLGFCMLINNRPDGEAADQPGSAEMKAAAEAAGLEYRSAPVVGRPGDAQVDAVRQAISEAKGPVLAFCRSGTRSITAWALGELAAGVRTRDELVELGRAAGYDLSQIL